MLRHPIAVLALAALLLAGCGGAGALSKSEYERRVGTVMTDVKESDVFSGEGQPKSTDLTKGATVMDAAAADLRKLEPPSDVDDLHADLVDGVSEFGDLLGGMAPLLEGIEKKTATAEEQIPKLTQIQKDLTATTAGLQKTIDAFESKGYDTNAG